MAILLIVLYLITPALLILACQRFPLLDKIGVVVLAFALGIFVAALQLLPDFAELASLQENLIGISVALALPLLVFSMDILAAVKFSGQTFKGLMLAFLSVITMSFVAAVLFAPYLPHIWQIAGMSVGVYTGGGPNMAAIKTALDADMAIFTDMLTYDIVLSALYVLFIITFAKPLFSRVLKPFQQPKQLQQHAGFDHLADDTAFAYRSLIQPSLLLKTSLALLLSMAILAVAVVLADFSSNDMKSAVIIIAITTLGVLASFIPQVRNLPNSYPLGMYLILVFCFASGTMVNTNLLYDINWPLFGYISCILVGSLLLQAMLCRLFKIDVDTFLMSSAASIMSVPFIPVIAGALRNKYLLVPGFAAAILGYVLGNYLGISVAWTLKSFF